MSLVNIEIKREYRSLSDNMISEFYIPLLDDAIIYKRAVGFFSSSSLVRISAGISSLAQRGGKIYLVASPRLTEEDITSIRTGYKMRDEVVKTSLLRQLSDSHSDIELARLNLLANLIAAGTLDIKIALMKNEMGIGMYHEKMGVIEDTEGNVVAFSGSMNETSMAITENYEAIDVFCSWKNQEDLKRVQIKEIAFDRIWNDKEPNISIIHFPELKDEIINRYKVAPPDYSLDKLKYSAVTKNPLIFHDEDKQGVIIPDDVSLYDYQIQAIDQWEKNGFRGIFDMATGTGKTYTALAALARLSTKTNNNIAIFIVCPFQHLVEQWVEDLQRFNLNPIVGYSDSKDKKFKKMLDDAIFRFNLGAKKIFCFISTNATFSSDDIRNQVKTLIGNSVLVVDEAHYFGAEGLSKSLSEVFTYRLALSATLERHNDELGTNLLKEYFGEKCIEYTLKRAIEEGKLTPYYYYPIVVYLSDDELEKYNKITIEMSKCIKQDRYGKATLSESGKLLAIKRSKIVAGAQAKVGKLIEIIKDYTKDTHMLIYCGATKLGGDDDEEDIRQIDLITRILGNDYEMNVAMFTSRENREERKTRIRNFTDGEIQALVAIKCLDEGVNIPQIRTAFILASTTNPKEYIQRRGRVLRLAKGKEYAKIYDFVTLPRPLYTVSQLDSDEINKDLALVKNELNRIKEFKELALNSCEADKLTYDIEETYSLYSNNFEEQIYLGGV